MDPWTKIWQLGPIVWKKKKKIIELKRPRPNTKNAEMVGLAHVAD
jgi:hypothetical protein